MRRRGGRLRGSGTDIPVRHEFLTAGTTATGTTATGTTATGTTATGTKASSGGVATAAAGDPPRVTAVTAIVTSRGEATAQVLSQLPEAVTVLEVRADLAGDLDPTALRRHFRGQLVYSLRTAEYGGTSVDRDDSRRARLLAARGYDVVDLETDRDLAPEVLAGIAEHRRRISWYGGPTDVSELRARFERMVAVPARLYLLAPWADSFASAVAPLGLLKLVGRRDVTAFATGPLGRWTRIVAAWLGTPVVFGRLSSTVDGSAADLPTVAHLLNDYPFPALPPVRALYGIAGASFRTPLFVNRQNAAYRALALPYLFLPFIVPDEQAFRIRFWPGVVDPGTDALGMPMRGLTVAAPYKDIAAAAAPQNPDAYRSQAANLMLRQADGWLATTTDGNAALTALRRAYAAGRAGAVPGAATAVLGCGGAGRAAAVSLTAAGARVTLVNRGEARGRFAAELLGLRYVPLDRFDPARYEIVVNATPAQDDLPFDIDRLADGATVVDFVCAAHPTALVMAARGGGRYAVDGHAVLAAELDDQFRLMTGKPMPAAEVP